MEMNVCMYLKAFLFGCIVFVSDASVTLSTDGSIGSRNIFECNTEVIIVCKTELNPNIVVLKINNKEVLDCTIGFCTPTSANYQNHLLNYDLNSGTFNLTKQSVDLSDNGNTYECIGETDDDTFAATVKVFPEKSTSSITSSNIYSGTEIRATTGCVFPASDVTFSWFFYKVGSSNRMAYNESKSVNESTDATSCAVGSCRGNGVETKQSSLVIETVADGCDYTFEVEIKSDSDPGNAYVLTEQQILKLDCGTGKGDTINIIIPVVIPVILEWLQKCCLQIYIVVLILRAVINIDSTVVVKRGKDVLLQGSSSYEANWSRDDNEMCSGIKQGSSLLIPDVKLDDDGTYICHNKGNIIHTVSLEVVPTTVRTEITATRGTNVILPCSIENDVRCPIYVKKEYGELKNKLQYTEQNDLILKEIKSIDAGEYMCKMDNFGSRSTSLYVTEPEGHVSSRMEVKVGDKAILPRLISEVGKTGRWKVPFKPFIIDEDYQNVNSRITLSPEGLILVNVSENDEGEYKFYCEKRGTHKIQLVVTDRKKKGQRKKHGELDVPSETFNGYHDRASFKEMKDRREIRHVERKSHIHSVNSVANSDYNHLSRSAGVEIDGYSTNTYSLTTLQRVDSKLEITEHSEVSGETTAVGWLESPFYYGEKKSVWKEERHVKMISPMHAAIDDLNLSRSTIVGSEEEKTSIVRTSGDAGITLPSLCREHDKTSIWHKLSTNGLWKQLKSNSNLEIINHNLNIKRLGHKDSGIYRFSNQGKVIHDIILIVTDPFEGLKKSTLTALLGSELTLQSFFDKEDEIPQWKHGQKIVRNVPETNSDLILKKVSSNDGGKYECGIPHYGCHTTEVAVVEDIISAIGGRKFIGVMCILAMVIPVFGIIPLLILWCRMIKVVFHTDETDRMCIAGMCCILGGGLWCCLWDICNMQTCSKDGTTDKYCTCCNTLLIILGCLPVIGIPFIIILWYKCLKEKP